MRKTKKILALVVATAIILSTLNFALAAGRALGFGYWDQNNLRGQRVHVLTSNPPDGLMWTASPVAICRDHNCDTFFETGWIKGTAYGLNNQLKQYVSYKDTDGTTQQVFGVGSNLNTNTWYQFRVMYSQSANRWEAWRFDSVVWYAPHDLGWTSGVTLAAGGETNTDGDWINVWGWHPERRVWGGAWTLYNPTVHGTVGQAHFSPAYDYGYHVWGP
ncbi:MAG TPA: hypothetical protein PKJ56_03145 [Promineifilum sp.]|nr:hypothetical protein [Promineifilum sp.]HNS39226.1 hypothetical protein [Promineifilum sp.]